MRAFLRGGLLAATILVAVATQAFAWHVSGRVFCEGNGLPAAGVEISVTSTNGAAFTNSGLTDNDGVFYVGLTDNPQCFRATVVLGSGQTAVNPASGYIDFCTTVGPDPVLTFVIASPTCSNPSGACWLTGGGAKFFAITGTRLGEHGPTHNWGGNVNPGCSPIAGDGGSWNHIDRDLRLHFHGQAITVVRCGNVDGITPGSTSPVTPFNFIEFTGTGTLKGIQGNKADYGIVNFFARCEDRNEPGSSGETDGSLKDRYFIRVYDNSGNTLLLLDQDGDPSTVDPVIITKGNMQIHVSSCDVPAATASSSGAAQFRGAVQPQAAGKAAFEGISFVAGPNPTRGMSFMRFALPREANVRIAAFDVSGRLVRQILTSRVPAGEHNIAWNLRDMNGRNVGTGVYFVRLIVDGRTYGRAVTVMP